MLSIALKIRTNDANFGGFSEHRAAGAHAHGTRVRALVDKVHAEQRQRPIPQVVEGVGHAGLLDQLAILQPDHLQLVEWARIGDALQLGNRAVARHDDVLRRHDNGGWNVDGLGAVHRQLDVVGVLLLAQLGIGSSHPARKTKYTVYIFKKFTATVSTTRYHYS